MSKKLTERKQPRNAKDGRFVSPKYAERHPDTTVVETIVFSPPRKKLKKNPFTKAAKVAQRQR